MDNGEVIQGLNEDWTLAGAKLGEWVAGAVMAMLAQSLIFQQSAARYMPVILAIGAITTFSLSAFRRKFEDEERGIRNYVMVMVGIPPPNLPTPAALQPYWSAAPLRELDATCDLVQLQIDKLLELPRSSKEEDEVFDVPWRKNIGMSVSKSAPEAPAKDKEAASEVKSK